MMIRARAMAQRPQRVAPKYFRITNKLTTNWNIKVRVGKGGVSFRPIVEDVRLAK